jgi:hypothetical protein
MLAACLANPIIVGQKLFFKELRPYFEFDEENLGPEKCKDIDYGFPSGHAV